MFKLTYFVLAACCLALGGCAATYNINVPIQEVHDIKLIDLRPVDEREGKLLPFGRDFSHGMLADSSFQPDRLSILKSKLHERFGDKLAEKQIELRMFRIIQYNAPKTNIQAVIFRGSPLESIGIPDPNRSWFVGAIELTVGGRKFTGNSAVEIEPGFGTMKTAMPSTVLNVIENLLANMASAMEKPQ